MDSIEYKKLYKLQDKKFLDNFEDEYPVIVQEITEYAEHI